MRQLRLFTLAQQQRRAALYEQVADLLGEVDDAYERRDLPLAQSYTARARTLTTTAGLQPSPSLIQWENDLAMLSRSGQVSGMRQTARQS